MGNGMNKILPGLYIGNFRDAKDAKQLADNNITHIVSIHDNAKKLLKDKEYLCIIASDSPDQDLTKFFPQVSKFIHKARLDGGNVLVHCLAGVSRSVTVTAAYIMTITNLGWRDSLYSIRGARSVANPNFGFQKQLQNFESDHLEEERKRFKAKFPHNPFNDEEECRANLRCYQQYIMTGNLPARVDVLYPLPPGAYQTKKEAEKQKDSSEVESHEVNLSKHKKSGGRSHHHHHHHHHHHSKDRQQYASKKLDSPTNDPQTSADADRSSAKDGSSYKQDKPVSSSNEKSGSSDGKSQQPRSTPSSSNDDDNSNKNIDARKAGRPGGIVLDDD